ncbi:hypothetical protein K443DRAFT_682160 [Laccaria amethystina LaAM-08-1]|uniref:Uncharacterized protein n=1 Tax=Laccaria amethystina LaAM-08-1 TaxID=1095629 RepID=A0A0C9WKU0_9AGAR|nr:hypothetical protein K443DRAFT_682160 [Laccaria amethystina LaAM-08-1]
MVTTGYSIVIVDNGIPVKELVTSEVMMGSFMLKDGDLNDAEHAISFDLNQAQCIPIGSREEYQCYGEW